MMRVLSLCAGIGGIDLAAEATGHMEIVGQVELDDFCTSVLAHHWPHVKRMRDLKEVHGNEFGTIHLIVAGFPCQPASHAGKRRGASDDRWLWPEVHRVIQSVRPAWVLCENVPGLITLGLNDVLSDLDGAGYEAAACVYPASAVGAPHQRERIFIVGHLANTDRQRQRQPQGRVSNERRWTHDGCEDVAHTYQHSGRWAQRADYRDVDGATGPHTCREGYTQRATAECGRADVADTARARLANRQQARQRTDGTQGGTGMESEPERRGAVAYAERLRRQRRQSEQTGNELHRQTPQWQQSKCDTGDGHAEYRRGGQAQPRLGRELDGLPGRLAEHPGWPARPGEAQYGWEAPRTIPASDKTPHRAAKLKALGNAVVPAQVYPVLAAIAAAWEATR